MSGKYGADGQVLCPHGPEARPVAGGKYAGMLPSVYERLLAEALPRHKSAKDAEKAARRALHGIAEAYFPREEHKRALKLLAREDAAPEALLPLHASTRERLGAYDAFIEAMHALWPDARTLLDIACGINPVALGARGYAVVGLDMHVGCVEVVNTCAKRFGLPIEARAADVLDAPALPTADAALLLKLLPLLERQRTGSAAELLSRVPARRMAVSFPAKTLGGRGVGMRAHYRAMLEDMLPEGAVIEHVLDTPNETFYFIDRASPAS